MAAVLRMSADGSITLVQEEDGSLRVATQDDMDRLDVGDDLTDEECDVLEE